MPPTAKEIERRQPGADKVDVRRNGAKSSSNGTADSEATVDATNIQLIPGYWVARTRAAVVVACEEDLDQAISVAEKKGLDRNQFALARYVEEESPFGGVEIEEFDQ